MATRVMATSALLLLAVFALAVEGNPKSFPAMFKDFRDFREGKHGKAKTASSNYGYEESELQAVCLRQLTRDSCRDFEGQEYWETDVGCCSEDYHKHQDVFRLPEDLKVGKCWWTLHYTGIPDRRQPGGPGDDFRGVFLVGTYEMTCEMEEESEKCGEPLCDDLILKGWGRLWLDTNAAIKGKPTVTGCDISDRRTAWFQRPAAPAQTPAVKPAEPAREPALQPDVPVQKPARKPATPVQKPAEPVQKPIEPAVKPAEPAQKPAEPTQRPAQQPGVPAQKPAEPAQRPLRQLVGNTNPAKIASADYYYHDEHEAEYFLGAAYVYDGYVQVQSCSKKVVYKEGKMQAVGSYEIYPGPDSPVAGSPPLPPTPITPSPDQFIAKPYTMDFILRKANDY